MFFYCLSGLSLCTRVCLSVRGPVFLIYCLSLSVQDGLYFFGRWFLSFCSISFLYVRYFIFLILIQLVYFVYLLDGPFVRWFVLIQHGLSFCKICLAVSIYEMFCLRSVCRLKKQNHATSTSFINSIYAAKCSNIKEGIVCSLRQCVVTSDIFDVELNKIS